MSASKRGPNANPNAGPGAGPGAGPSAESDAGPNGGPTAAAATRGAAADEAPPSRVRLRILDKEVQLSCPPDEQDELLQAAAYVDRAMRELRRRNTTSSFEKIAIVTAINTASSLLQARSRAGEESDARTRVARVNARLDELLTGGDERVTPTAEDVSSEDVPR